MKKIVKLLIVLIVGFCVGAVTLGQYLNKIIMEKEKLSDKHLKMFQLMKLWVTAYQEKKSIEKYLLESGYQNIAIYGMSFIGETLYHDLMDSSIKVLYGIDQSAISRFYDFKVYHPDEQLPEVDVVIVTAVTYFNDIEAALVSKMNCPIISIEDILLEM